MNARVYLSLGSNVGERSDALTKARDFLANDPNVEIDVESRVLENPAVLVEDQPDFLNQVVVIQTEYSPRELLSLCQAIETKLGRKTRERYGPREIDVDILDYDGVQMHTDDLTLPHPGLQDRGYLHTLLGEMGPEARALIGEKH